MPTAHSQCRHQGPFHRGYALLVVVVVMACMSVFVGVVARMLTAAANLSERRENRCRARWAADAGVEYGLWHIGRQRASGANLDGQLQSDTNACHTRIRITSEAPDRFRITSVATRARDETETKPISQASVAAMVAYDAPTGRLRIISWSEAPDSEAAP